MHTFHKFRSLLDSDYHQGMIRRAPVNIRQAERALAGHLAKTPVYEAREYQSPHVKKRVLSLNESCIARARKSLAWWTAVRDGRLMPVMSFNKSGNSWLEWVPTMVGEVAERESSEGCTLFYTSPGPAVPISEFKAFCRDWKIMRMESIEEGWLCWAQEQR